MIVAGWSVKGGSGTTVVSTGIARELFTGPRPGVILDFTGDVSSLLGRSSQPRAGLFDWLLAEHSVAPPALEHLLDTGSPNILREGDGRSSLAGEPYLLTRLHEGLRWLDTQFGGVVIDVGSATDWIADAMCEAADVSLLVLRPCSLSVRAAAQSNRSVAGIVLVGDGGRSLMPRDIEGLLGVPLLAHVRTNPLIAHCVDNGRFGKAIPRELRRVLRPVLHTIRAAA